MEKRIPIFPLNLVVFPNSKYPLHIFEERYKKMISRCIYGQTGFGIVPEIRKEMSKLGCYVIISAITNKYDNGESDIIVKGLNRFKIKKIEMHPDGYYLADVDEYNDIHNEADSNLINELQELFEKILEKIEFSPDEDFWKNFETAGYKSFKLAEKSGLNLEQQLALLSLKNENKRLLYLIEHLDKLEKEIENRSVLDELIRNDGYINSSEYK
ncbi:MAG: LON peptidase substrate-binding domain-containing protein [Syntrophothermus sp.]